MLSNIQTITIGGGCFWCVEAVYELVARRHARSSPATATGMCINPSYQQVCGGDTGHVEVVKVTLSTPDVISLVRRSGDLLPCP